VAVKRMSLNRFIKELQQLPAHLDEAIIKGLQSTGTRMVGVVTGEIETAKPYPAVDRGELKQSVNARNLPDGSVVSVDAPHAPFIEYGTRPHMPPIEPLVEWARRKGIADDEDEAEEIGGAIAHSIARFGTKPRRYMAKASKKIVPIAKREIDAELEQLARRRS
jgi:hypothetical protein